MTKTTITDETVFRVVKLEEEEDIIFGRIKSIRIK